MLYQRYSNPTALLQQMIEIGQFNEFISELIEIKNKKEIDDIRWEFWLHRVSDMSFTEYVQLCEAEQSQSSGDIETTIKENFEMMENFHPE